MTDKDTRAAIIAVTLWSVTFAAGMAIADMVSRPVGFLLMFFSTLIFAVVYAMDSRLEAEKNRRKKYEADCARRELEVRNKN